MHFKSLALTKYSTIASAIIISFCSPSQAADWAGLMFKNLSSPKRDCGVKNGYASQVADHSVADEKLFIELEAPYAVLYEPVAMLKAAESSYDREDYKTAQDQLLRFLEMHLNHRLSPYVQYKLAQTYLKQATSYQKDIEPFKKAHEVLKKLKKEHPIHKFSTEAELLLRECEESLAKRSLFIAQFYLKKGNIYAAKKRFETIAAEFPETQTAAEGLYILAEANRTLGLHKDAIENLKVLLAQHTNYIQIAKVRALLKEEENIQLAASRN